MSKGAPIEVVEVRAACARRPPLFAATVLCAVLLAACAGRSAPGCDAEPTRELAIREAIKTVSTRGGSREVPGRPDLLVSSGGDTSRFVLLNGRVNMHTGQGTVTAILENVQTTGRDRESGGWTCGGEMLMADLSAAGSPLPAVPISYTSALTEGGRHTVEVRVRWDQMR